MHATLLFLIGLMVAGILTMASPAAAATTVGTAVATSWVFVAGKQGISLFRFDAQTGSLVPAGSGIGIGDGYLALSPDGKFLYATNTVTDANKKRTGEVVGFSIDRSTGALTLLNRQPSHGDGPCHVTVDPQGKNVLVANYSSATAAVFPIDADGRLKEASCVVTQTGSSVDPQRQTRAYAHSVNVDPSGKFAFVADLGADKLFVYHFDCAKGMLTPNEPPAYTVVPGSGPRHFTFDPQGRFAYLINEMIGGVVVYSNQLQAGQLKQVQLISALPADFKGTNTSAEIEVHPSGKFLYASNRGDTNFITVFSIDGTSGMLKVVEYQPTLGKTPRNFRIDPTGKYLLVANQDSASLALFSIDQQTGKLAPVGKPIDILHPMGVVFLGATQ